MSAHRQGRHLGLPVSRFIPAPTVGVQEPMSLLEDCFPTQPLRLPRTDTRPLRGAW